jgi:hypothetical protein
MKCTKARQQWLQGRDQAGADEQVAAHWRDCQDCRQFVAANEALDRLLTLDTAEEAGPGFDTRFFARLAEERRAKVSYRPRFWRAGIAALATVAASLLWVLWPSHERMGMEDIEVAANLELLQNYEVIAHLDELEAFEALTPADGRQPSVPQGLPQGPTGGWR